MIAILSLLLLIGFQEAPYKAKDDFEIKPALLFKQRGHSDNSSVYPNETRKEHERRTSSEPLPYLQLQVKLLKTQPAEAKVRVIRDNGFTLLNKKITEGLEFQLEAGFSDDIKDRISGYKFEINFLSSEKEVLSRILIEFDEEGTYFVNGEKRGKI
ncbi:MAG: hypothetical protein WAZ98_13490 [Cyclobacteriaceae bacterium]